MKQYKEIPEKRSQNAGSTPVRSKNRSDNYESLRKRVAKDILIRPWNSPVRNLLKVVNHTLYDEDSPNYIQDFEDIPFPQRNPKILFSTRVYDPLDGWATTEEGKREREVLNQDRVDYIRRCKEEFGDLFYGGLYVNEYSKRHFPDCCSPDGRKTNYLRRLKESDICIATTGLRASTGWKLAEYVAASKAVVSEKITHELPGSFRQGDNYLEFSSPEELIARIYELLRNHALRYKMMKNNHDYYLRFVRPDSLVLNTLSKVVEKDLEN